MFDGAGNPNQNLTHFLSACGNIVWNGSLLLRQFVLSLEGVTFDWYSRLAPVSIPDWQSMKQVFLDHFYSTRQCVGLRELSAINQGRDEPAAEYINRWCALSLHCSQEMMQEQAVKLFMSGLHSWIQLQIREVAPKTLDHMSTVATDLELYYKQHLDHLATVQASYQGKSKKFDIFTNKIATNELHVSNGPKIGVSMHGEGSNKQPPCMISTDIRTQS